MNADLPVLHYPLTPREKAFVVLEGKVRPEDACWMYCGRCGICRFPVPATKDVEHFRRDCRAACGDRAAGARVTNVGAFVACGLRALDELGR